MSRQVVLPSGEKQALWSQATTSQLHDLGKRPLHPKLQFPYLWR